MMMNPNVYMPTVQQQQSQQQQHQPQQQPQQPPPPMQSQYPPGWPPVSAPPSTQAGGGGPPTSMSAQQQPGINGNYQQQLATSMGGLSVNPMKQLQQQQQQPFQTASMPMPAQTNVSYSNANMAMPPLKTIGPATGMAPPQQSHQTPLTNGPPQTALHPQQQQQPQQQQPQMPPTLGNNNNYSSQSNGQPPTKPAAAPAPGMYATPPAQAIPGGANQMTVNSASVPGMPHMPPKTATPTPSSFQPPISGPGAVHAPPLGAAPGGMLPPPQQQQPPLQQQQQYTPQQQQMPPRSGQQQPPMMQPSMGAGQPPMPQPGGMPPMPQPGGMPSMPQPGIMPPMPQPSGMPPMPQPGIMPPMPQPSGMPPMPQPGGMPPMPQPSAMPPMPQPGGMTGYAQQGYAPQQPQGYPPQQAQQPGGYPGQQMPPPPQPGQPMAGRPGGAYNQAPGGGMYQPPQPQQYAQAQRRLDPDQMPNPIQVMIENQRMAGGTFVTNEAGQLPPLVTTKYIVQDQGNASPRFVRSSLYCVPATADLLKSTALPFTFIVSPFARTVAGEYEPPIVDFGTLGPIRCNRCKGYMSPNMQFTDAGRRFMCLMCKFTTEVPTEYFQHLDHTGQRVDKYERPELVLGTYEFLATKDYCRNNIPPQVPAFVFVIDVSYNTIKSGLVHLLCSQVKRILSHLPIDQGHDRSKVRVGFITYNSTVHFYNIKSSLAQPQMMVVGDVQDMFMPLLDGFLCDPEESATVIDALMEQIPRMFVDTKETETILYPAIQAGVEALKAYTCAGKLLVFNSTLPIAEAPGKLKNRDDRKLLGGEKEKTVLTPQCTSYSTLGQECVQNGCSVDLFLFNNAYIDIATIGQVSRLTGGEVFKYTYFQADTDGKRLIEDIIKNVSRPIAFDAVMRVRTSGGIRATDFYGHFFMSNTTDVELASVDATKSIGIEIKHDDKLPPEENVYLQIALLYTSCSGQRRLRILNLALRATTTIAEVFKCCDLDAIMLFFAKQACFKLMELSPKLVKDNLIHRSAQILACYRKHCTSPTSAGQLILPECLKLLPLYVSCLLKNDAVSGGADMTLDDRSYVIQFVLAMDLNMSVHYLYPRFMPIHGVQPDDDDASEASTELPAAIRCTQEKMVEDGAYILENGVYLFVWLGQSLPPSFVQPVFGVQCTQQVNSERFAVTGDTPLAARVRAIIAQIMSERTRYMKVTCVRQNDKLESVFRHFLIEDRGTDGSASYVDFLCHMHKEIKDLVS